MSSFIIPTNPLGLLDVNEDSIDRYQVEKENAPQVGSLSEKQRKALLIGIYTYLPPSRDAKLNQLFTLEVGKRLIRGSEIVQQHNFDTLYILLRYL